MSESANSMIGRETREKAPLELFLDIVMQSGAKLANQAALQINNPLAVHTPFALSKFNAEMELAKTSKSTILTEERLRFSGGTTAATTTNRVQLTFDDNDPTKHQHTCTCGFCERWRIPCRHLIAAAKARNEQGKLLELIDQG
eukprot:g5840.t2